MWMLASDWRVLKILLRPRESQQTLVNWFASESVPLNLPSCDNFDPKTSSDDDIKVYTPPSPAQWHAIGPNFLNQPWHNVFQKWNQIKWKSDEIIASESDPNWAVVVPTWHYLSRISAELCRFVRNFGTIVPFLPNFGRIVQICSEFRQNCADFETISFRIVPRWHYSCSKFWQNCADLFRILAELCRFVRNFGRIVLTCSKFRQNCADSETMLCRIVSSLCQLWDYFLHR